MDKRFFLALFLSSIIWIFWHSVVMPPQAVPPGKEAQVIDIKEDVQDSAGRRTAERGPLSFPETREKKEEQQAVINNGKIEAVLTTRGGRISQARVIEHDAVFPVADLWNIAAFSELDFDIESQDQRQVVFQAHHDGWLIRKIFSFSDGDYIVSSEVRVQNNGKGARRLPAKMTALALDLSVINGEADNSRDRNLMEYSVLADGKVFRKTGAYKFVKKENKSVEADAQWFGFRDRYFSAIVAPDFPVNGYEVLADPDDEKKLSLYAVLDEQILAEGESRSFPAVFYLGPQNSRIMKEYGQSFEKIHVYFSLGFLDAIAKIIEDVVILMYKIIPNWGVAIILVSLLIYFVMYPLTMKSMISMRKMQSLQPKILELRVKNEKNPQKLNQEIMQLYKDNKVNPMGGCLPLLLQMPIFISLYQMIWRSVIFKGSEFLWIKDLSQPDRLFVLARSFPVIGNEINILPIIILILMVVQQKMTSKNMVITDPNQLMQQKMMLFMMPAVLLLVFYRIASGLTIYLTIFYLMSSFTQWRIAKITKVG